MLAPKYEMHVIQWAFTAEDAGMGYFPDSKDGVQLLRKPEGCF